MTNDPIWEGKANPEFRYWLARVSDELPGAASETVATLALHLCRAAVDGFSDDKDNGSLANALADLGDAQGLTRHALLADMQPGDIDALRAIHAWVKADQDGAPSHAPAPDPYDGQRHTVIRKRSRSGKAGAKVTGRGVAQVQGSMRPWFATRVDRKRASATDLIVCHWIDQYRAMMAPVRRGRYGANVIGVTKLTNRQYRGIIEPMCGTDVVAYAEDPLGTTERVDWFGHHQDIGGFASTPELRREMTGTGMVDQYATDDNRATPWAKPDTTGLEWDARYKLPAVKARKSEHATASALPAPSAIAGTIWIGHHLIERGPTARRRTVKDVRTVGAFKLRPGTDDAEVMLRDLAPGMRVTITHGAWRGSITANGKPTARRYSGSITSDRGEHIAWSGDRSMGRTLARLADLT